jgi:hypothetical protein
MGGAAAPPARIKGSLDCWKARRDQEYRAQSSRDDFSKVRRPLTVGFDRVLSRAGADQRPSRRTRRIRSRAITATSRFLERGDEAATWELRCVPPRRGIGLLVRWSCDCPGSSEVEQRTRNAQVVGSNPTSGSSSHLPCCCTEFLSLGNLSSHCCLTAYWAFAST